MTDFGEEIDRLKTPKPERMQALVNRCLAIGIPAPITTDFEQFATELLTVIETHEAMIAVLEGHETTH